MDRAQDQDSDPSQDQDPDPSQDLFLGPLEDVSWCCIFRILYERIVSQYPFSFFTSLTVRLCKPGLSDPILKETSIKKANYKNIYNKHVKETAT